MPKKPAFCLDTQICTGCKTCMIACKDKNNLDTGVLCRRVYEYSGGEWLPLPDGTFRQDVFAYYISVSCNHCSRPICVEVCPTGAMNQDINGIVTVNESRCMGCRYCEWACPYGAPQYRVESGCMTKCDFCRNELETGGVPACVAACPTRALSFGERDGLEAKQNKNETFAPLPNEELTEPSTFFRPHSRSKPVDSPAGQIANLEEIDGVPS
jgi:anaerobic dimethyl sulfoxide reductase subunit B